MNLQQIMIAIGETLNTCKVVGQQEEVAMKAIWDSWPDAMREWAVANAKKNLTNAKTDLDKQYESRVKMLSEYSAMLDAIENTTADPTPVVEPAVIGHIGEPKVS